MSQSTSRRDFIRTVGAGAVAAAGTISTPTAACRAARVHARQGAHPRRQRPHQRRLCRLWRPHEHPHHARDGPQQGQGRRAGDCRQRHLGDAQEAGAAEDRCRRQVGVPRLPRTGRAPGHRRGRHRVTRSLALRPHDGGARGRQGRLPREADDLHGGRGAQDRRVRQDERPDPAGRQPVHLARSLPQGEEGHRGRADRRGRLDLGRIRPQQHEARQRVELQDRPRRQPVQPRLEGVHRQRAEA